MGTIEATGLLPTAPCYNTYVSSLNGRWRGIAPREESPGDRGQGQPLTAAGSDPRESATETIPPVGFG